MRDARYALWGTALLLLLIVPPALAGFAGIGWEASQWAGYAGALACIALAGSPVRPRSSAPPTLVSLRLHTLIGWLALLAVALHIGGLVLADRTVLEYLKPTAPLYQLAGIAATLRAACSRPDRRRRRAAPAMEESSKLSSDARDSGQCARRADRGSRDRYRPISRRRRTPCVVRSRGRRRAAHAAAGAPARRDGSLRELGAPPARIRQEFDADRRRPRAVRGGDRRTRPRRESAPHCVSR